MAMQIAERRPARAPIPARIAGGLTPHLFADTRQGQTRFWEFFGANIRNANTRLAYVTAAYRFGDWCAARGLTLAAMRPLHVAGYIEQLTRTYAAAEIGFKGPPHLVFMVTAAEAWLAKYPDDTEFWVNRGIGKRLCALIDNIHGQQQSLLGYQDRALRGRVDVLLAALVGLGVPEAVRLEQTLAANADESG